MVSALRPDNSCWATMTSPSPADTLYSEHGQFNILIEYNFLQSSHVNLTRFSNKDMIRDPRTKHFCENGDTFNGWIGPDVHFLFSTIKNGQDCCWVLTHKVCGHSSPSSKWLANQMSTRMKPTSKNHGPSPATSKTYTK